MLQSHQTSVSNQTKVDPFDPAKRQERRAANFLRIVSQNAEKTRREAPYVALGRLLRKEYIFVAQQIATQPRGKRTFQFGDYTASLSWAPVNAEAAASRANSEDVSEFENKTVCFIDIHGLKFIHEATIRSMDPFSEVLAFNRFYGKIEKHGITFFASHFNEDWAKVANLDPEAEAPLDVIDVDKLNRVFDESARKARRDDQPKAPRLNLVGEVSASETPIEEWWAQEVKAGRLDR